MIGAYNRTLKEAPRRFDGVGVHIAAHPFLGAVVYRLMLGIAVLDFLIGGVLISVDFLSSREPLLRRLRRRSAGWRRALQP